MKVVGTIFNLGSAPVLEQTLQFTEARHRLILSNVANSDTPNYRRQDLDEARFARSLDRAIRERRDRHPASFRMDDRAHDPISTWGGTFPGARVPRLAHEGPTRHDENNISMEREMSLLAMNGGKFRSMATLLHKEWSQLRAAITERPGT